MYKLNAHTDLDTSFISKSDYYIRMATIQEWYLTEDGYY